MNICAGCHKPTPLYGSKMLKLTDKEDMPLCPECGNVISNTIENTLYHLKIDSASAAIKTFIGSVG